MLKKLSATTKFFAALVIFVLIMMIVMISISENKPPEQLNTSYINDNASADNKVEALKTVTAELLSVENKNNQLQQTVANLQTQNKAALDDLKKSVSTQVQQAIQQIQTKNQENQKNQEIQKNQQNFVDNLKQKENSQSINSPFNDNQNNSSFIWISDLSQNKENRKDREDRENIKDRETNEDLELKKSHSLLDINDNDHSLSSLLNTSDHPSDVSSTPEKKVKPAYTIELNATLTGATLMTPLVGRIPIDGKLPSPYYFKLVLSARNLTANGYPMPGIKGAVMGGVASGDMLGSCARGDINSISFIFNDGTISSTSSTESNGDNDSLGYISGQSGDPCIAGTFHSNAVVFLGAQMMLSGAQGYANAISSSQYMNSTTPEGGSISTLIGSANKAAMGQGGSAAAEAAQTWWNRRVENSFDYVYVPNINPTTGKPMKIVVNITHQIPINFDPNARKVNYESSFDSLSTSLD